MPEGSAWLFYFQGDWSFGPGTLISGCVRSLRRPRNLEILRPLADFPSLKSGATSGVEEQAAE